MVLSAAVICGGLLLRGAIAYIPGRTKYCELKIGKCIGFCVSYSKTPIGIQTILDFTARSVLNILAKTCYRYRRTRPL